MIDAVNVDAVISWHMNGAICGVAKFNHRLAKQLRVPCQKFGSPSPCGHPLISIKFQEADVDGPLHHGPYSLFLHDTPTKPWHWYQLRLAVTVYAANAVIARLVRPTCPDVIEAFCPSTLQGDPTRADLNVLTFGMAHKLQWPYYEKLKGLLDATGQDYTVSVSTAVHEGSSWAAVSEAGDKLRAIFKDKTRVLGYLADDALARELQECSATAMFFDPALRANNTTFWAAMEAGAVVITNLDSDSPRLYAEDRFGTRPAVQTWADINCLVEWPSTLLTDLRSGRVQSTRPCGYTWIDLLGTMGLGVTA